MKSSKGKSKQRWGEWSEWYWEADQQFWYRMRQDTDGKIDYGYNTTAGQESIPRGSDDQDVEEITQGIENLSPHSDPYESPEYQVSGSRPSAGSGKGRSGKSSKGKERRTRDDEDVRKSSRDPRRQPAVEEDEEYTYPATKGGAYPTSDAYYQDPYTSGSSSRPAYDGTDATYNAAGANFDTTYTAAPAAYPDYSAYGSSGPAYAYSPYEPGEEDGRLTPKAGGASSSRPSQMAADVSEALDPRYRVERSDRFQPGEIFKAGWAEPKGAANDVLTGLSGKQEIEDTRGVTFITGFRRFIVIANDQGHSTCVPILSYGGKACTKRGVKPEKHGIIHQRGQRPKLLDREPKLGFPPVKVDITMEGEKLSKESRVNYSKLVTVEHNVKVMFIGTIAANDWPIVPDAINRCWDQKDHHKRSSHRR